MNQPKALSSFFSLVLVICSLVLGAYLVFGAWILVLFFTVRRQP
jgi:hypothetical protein